MSIQVDSSSASQAQQAVTNLFQNRQDSVRDAAHKDDDKDKDKAKTKPAHTAAAQGQHTETKHHGKQALFKTADAQESGHAANHGNGQRGGLVNLSV